MMKRQRAGRYPGRPVRKLRFATQGCAEFLTAAFNFGVVEHPLAQKCPQQGASPVGHVLVLVCATRNDVAQEPLQPQLNLVAENDAPGIRFQSGCV